MEGKEKEQAYEWEEAAGAVVTYLRRCRDGYFRGGGEEGGGRLGQSYGHMSVGLEDVELAVKVRRLMGCVVSVMIH